MKLFRGVLFGVQHAHEKEIIHRDLAPNNILVYEDEDGLHVKIIDFGISKLKIFLYEEQNTVNHYFNQIYSSPEQKAQKRVSNLSDIFSLGKTLFFMLSGQNPLPNNESFDDQINNLEVDKVIQDTIRKATNSNISSRYLAIESLLNSISYEIDKIETQDSKVTFKITQTLINDLFNMSIIAFPRESEVKKFLIQNDGEYYIYRAKNNRYHIICDLIRFNCTVDRTKGLLVLTNADELESYSSQEKIIARAFPIKVDIAVGKFSVSPDDRLYLFKFLEKVDIEYRDFLSRKKNKGTEDRLISLWSKRIDQQKNLLQNKNNVGYYKDIEYDVETGLYHFSIESIDDVNDLEAGKDISLFNKKKNRLEKIGKIKKYSDEVIHLSPIDSFNIDNYNKSGRFGIDYSDSLKVAKRAKKALDSLKQGLAANKNLLDIIIDPSLGKTKPITKKIEYANKKIDKLNGDAVISALGTQDIFLIQGPPGTGKSTVINELIYQIRQLEHDSKILLASQSHVAVDHIFNKLKEYFPEDLLVRIGNSDKISKESEANKIVNQTIKWTSEIKKSSFSRMEDFILTTDLRKILFNISVIKGGFFKGYNRIMSNDYPIKEKEFAKTIALWYRSLDSLKGFDNLLLGKSSIIASTCVGVSTTRVMDDITFDWVIIDEAAKSTVPEVLIPMIKGKKIILVGDHRQLPPIINKFENEVVSKKANEDLTESLFEDLFVLAKDSDITITLSKQFRMHPAISSLISKVFYEDDDIEIITDILPEERVVNYRIKKPIVWLSTERLSNNKQQETTAKSYSNICEANVILEELDFLNAHNINGKNLKIGVISAYSGQKSLLEKIVKPSSNKWNNVDIVIENIDAFQGSEVDVVIYSVVRSNTDRKIGFLNEQRRLNVALSRAKSQVIIVGDALFMKEASKKVHNYFEDVLIYMSSHTTNCELEVIKNGI